MPSRGRSKETTIVKNKPTPVGFKIWVVAQHGFFLRWLWHVKASPYTAVIVKLPLPHEKGERGKLKTTVALNSLFSSPNLFRALQEAGYGATGTARLNCGISKVLKKAQESDKSGNSATFQYNKVS
uniref:PiggyBac transposable element-derived protein domain-containing protein n=1 Tax=Fusarium oxysporum (strain Fo5176) TaxID=660025 RepID=A0A0C4BKQ5_FUSOF